MSWTVIMSTPYKRAVLTAKMVVACFKEWFDINKRKVEELARLAKKPTEKVKPGDHLFGGVCIEIGGIVHNWTSE